MRWRRWGGQPGKRQFPSREVSPGGSASAAFPIRGQYYPLWETCSM
ncbi:hypothetical protein HMPREF0239_03286 [Clostridium sp. ATCC BAA-442]|nr:hypothetical protein HMPREF0239_03286 [Clostridium sp. ATCC BAA-442]